jgi:hypothetical protein
MNLPLKETAHGIINMESRLEQKIIFLCNTPMAHQCSRDRPGTAKNLAFTAIDRLNSFDCVLCIVTHGLLVSCLSDLDRFLIRIKF